VEAQQFVPVEKLVEMAVCYGGAYHILLMCRGATGGAAADDEALIVEPGVKSDVCIDSDDSVCCLRARHDEDIERTEMIEKVPKLINWYWDGNLS
jgi:hypothetical protein